MFLNIAQTPPHRIQPQLKTSYTKQCDAALRNIETVHVDGEEKPVVSCANRVPLACIRSQQMQNICYVYKTGESSGTGLEPAQARCVISYTAMCFLLNPRSGRAHGFSTPLARTSQKLPATTPCTLHPPVSSAPPSACDESGSSVEVPAMSAHCPSVPTAGSTHNAWDAPPAMHFQSQRCCTGPPPHPPLHPPHHIRTR